MRIFEGKGQHVLVLDRGEPLMDSLVRFAEEHHLHGAVLQGIGALRSVELGYYDLEARAYRRHRLEGDYELLTLLGNISLKDGKPFAHVHVTLSGADFTVKGGHLFEAVVAVTAEIGVQPLGGELTRSHNEETGLHLLR